MWPVTNEEWERLNFPEKFTPNTQHTKGNKMTKSAYELRMEMLEMSKSYLETQYQTSVDFAKTVFDTAIKAGQATVQEWQKYAPKMYDFSDVVKKAEELYSFVNQK